MSGYCPDCGNQQCMCKEIEAIKKKHAECQHIYGYFCYWERNIYGVDELNKAKIEVIEYNNQKWMPENCIAIDYFNFCPLCGVRLNED